MARRRNMAPLGRALAARLPPAVRERLLGAPAWRRRNWLRAGIALICYGVTLVGVVVLLDPAAPEGPVAIWLLAPGIVALAFLFQTMDSTAGMGFGTALTPLLFAAGYGPLDVVPSLLISQAFAGLLSGWMHHELENVTFSWRRPLAPPTRALLIVTAIGVVGAALSIWLVYVAVRLPDRAIETYVALLVIGMGLLSMLRRAGPVVTVYREKRLVGFALLAGANKGLGGGGYGPVITLGAIHAGLPPKGAVALTVLAEGIVSMVGAAVFLALAGELDIDYSLLPSLLTGSFVAALAAPFLVHFIPVRIYRVLVPAYALLIGAFVLLRLYAS